MEEKVRIAFVLVEVKVHIKMPRLYIFVLLYPHSTAMSIDKKARRCEHVNKNLRWFHERHRVMIKQGMNCA